MDAKDWKFESMNFYNYSKDSMKGTISIRHMGTESKIEMKLLPEDLVRIFAILEDRVMEAFSSSARALFIEAGIPVKAFQPPDDMQKIPDKAPRDAGALDATDREADFGLGLTEG